MRPPPRTKPENLQMEVSLMSSHRTVARIITGGILSVAVAVGLAACSSEPTGLTEPLAESAIATWQGELDALAAVDGGSALLAEAAPLLNEARQAYLAETDKSQGALFLAVQRTSIEVVPPFPPPILNMVIAYQGVGTLLGKHAGQSPSAVDVTVMPWIQTGTATLVGADGAELVCQYGGTAVPTSEVGDVAFEGSFTVIGGTGRFESATGSGQYRGSANQVAAEGQIVWWGRVDLK